MKALLLISAALFACIPSYSQADRLPANNALESESSINGKQILVLGTFHFQQHKFDKYPQDMESVRRRLLKYEPEIMCVEWLPPSETNDLYNQDYSTRISELSKETGISKDEAPTIVSDLIEKLTCEPENITLRINLANALFISRDYVNACYQWYLIDCCKADLSQEQALEIERALPNKIETYRGALKGHEIEVLIFPVAKQLKLERLYSVDYMSDMQAMIKHCQTFIEEFKKAHGSDPIAESEMIKRIEKYRADMLEEDKNNGTSTYLEKLNSENYAKTVQALHYDFYFAYRNNKDFRIFYELNVEKRNWGIYDLILAAMQANNGKKVLALLGSSHKPFIERFFREWDEVGIVQLSDY